MRCPRCGKINPVGRTQCIYCAASLDDNRGQQRRKVVSPVNWLLILSLTLAIIIVVLVLFLNPFTGIIKKPVSDPGGNQTASSGTGKGGSGGNGGGSGGSGSSSTGGNSGGSGSGSTGANSGGSGSGSTGANSGGSGSGSTGANSGGSGSGSTGGNSGGQGNAPSSNSGNGYTVANNAQIPGGAVEIDGNYYYVYTGLNLSSLNACEQFCEDRGGHLAVITSDSLNDVLYQMCLDAGVKSAVIGYSDAMIEGNWEWVTAAQPAYTNWGKTEPNGAADEEDCCIFSTSEKNGKWNDSEFGHETSDFICQWNDYGIVDEPIQAQIPPDAVQFGGHYYYLFDNGKDNWSEAQNYCKSLGGDLVVVNDEYENAFLYEYMQSLGYGYAFIGYSDEESEGRWYWVSGKSSSYTDWGVNDDGEPEPNSDSRWENFAQLDVDMIAGTWNDSKFGYNTRAYICEWE